MFRRSGSVKLMNVAGIRIGVDGSWFVMLFVLIFLLSGSFRTALHSSDGVAYLTTVATVLLFFGSLILHELGHAVAARRQGIEVNRIELYLFGGLTQLSRDSRSPWEEFEVAAAGPLATFLFCLVCLIPALAIVGPHRLLHATVLDGTVSLTPVLLSLSWLLPMNLLILVFNLVPAFPLDGGRIARAAIWKVTGDRARGTRIACRMGEGFALLLAAAGLVLAASAGLFTGLWLMVLGYLLFGSAKQSLVRATFDERIAGVRISDIMDTHPVALPVETPIEEALDSFFERYRVAWLPVVAGSGTFVGIALETTVRAAVQRGDTARSVGTLLDPGDAAHLQVAADQPLSDVLSLESLRRLGAVMAVDPDGILRGVVTMDHVDSALRGVFATPVR